MDGISAVDGSEVAHLGLRCSGAGPYLLMGNLVAGIGATPHGMFGSNSVAAKQKRPQKASPEAAPRSPFPLQVRASGTSVPRIQRWSLHYVSKKEARQSRDESPGFRVFGGRWRENCLAPRRRTNVCGWVLVH